MKDQSDIDLFEECITRWGMLRISSSENIHKLTILAKNDSITLASYGGNLRSRSLLKYLSNLHRRDFLQNAVLIVTPVEEGRISLYLTSMWPGLVIAGENLPLSNLIGKIDALWTGDVFKFIQNFELNFGRKGLERNFVRSFKDWSKRLASAWQGLETDDEETRWELSLDTLLRLLFLAFLQEKSLLDGRKNFVMAQASDAYFRGENVFSSFLQTLFFASLNHPPNERPAQALAFGEIPFLNGGLFTPTNLEKLNSRHSVPNEVLMSILDEMMTTYHYALDTEDQNRLDPIMLGHVFESLMASSLRTKTGSFYTPQPIVQKLTRRSIIEYLHAATQVPKEKISKLYDNACVLEISKTEACDLDKCLADIRILDPSVGSGSFLAQAFDFIVQMRSALQIKLDHPKTSLSIARHTLTSNLFGVDILPEAVKICELRLWLSSLQTISNPKDLSPLPNLDVNIRCGNALIEPDNVSALGISKSESVTRLKELKQAYVNATGAEKSRLINIIYDETKILMKSQLRAAITRIEDKIHAQKLVNKNLPFAENTKLKPEQREIISCLENAKHMHCEALTSLEAGQIPCFSFSTHFPEIMRQGGFDIILANPPWRSIHKLPPLDREQLSYFFETARSVKSGQFKSQAPELASVFYEKSLQLLKESGIMSMVLPQKLFNAPSYAQFRRFALASSEILSRYDWSNKSSSLFDAANYPAALVVKKRSEKITVSPSEVKHWVEQEDATKADPMNSYPNKIGSHFCIRRGLFTGNNALFIPRKLSNHSENLAKATFSDSRSALIEKSMLKKICRGADISAYQENASQYLIFTHQSQNPKSPLSTLPKHCQSWFAHNERALKMRSDLKKSAPLHSLFRCYPEMFKPRVLWRDLSLELEACFINSPEPLALNTVYYIPVEDENTGYLLTAYLNSKRIRSFCRQRAERALGNYRRYFAWLIAEIPWPFPCIHSDELISLSKSLHKNPKNEKAKQRIDEIVDSFDFAKCPKRVSISSI